MIVSSSPEREADFESAISSFSKPRKRRRAPAVRFWNGWGAVTRARPSRGPSASSRPRLCESPCATGERAPRARAGGGGGGGQALDLARVVEAGAADEAVGDVAADERLLQGPRLGVGAVHHGEVAEGERRPMLRTYSFGEPLHLLG